MICELRFGAAVLLIVAISATQAVGQERKPNVTSDRYVTNQTFDGQSFFKDNNVWVYTPKFAETFGMPAGGIDVDLKGIEAAAFRIEDPGYKLCGMGGKAEDCKDNYRCVIDIYVDEAKNPLPWATDQKADWLFQFNSSNWLNTPSERVNRTRVPPGVIPNRVIVGDVRPFADPETHREANYFQNGDTPYLTDTNFNLALIYGYKRSVIAGQTLISLRHNCSPRNKEKPVVTYRLESREEIFSPPLKRFHQFQLPESFSNKIEAQLQVRWNRDREYYKNLSNLKQKGELP